MYVFIELFNFSFFSITGQGIDLDYHDIEWFALEINRDHSVIFEIASKYCLFNLYADYIMRNTGLEEAQAGIKIAGRNRNNLRYADDSTLMVESEEELKTS